MIHDPFCRVPHSDDKPEWKDVEAHAIADKTLAALRHAEKEFEMGPEWQAREMEV